MIYVETMVGTSTMIRCAVCGKMIRWPEEARAYAPSLESKPTRFEHSSHEALPDAQPYERGP